MGALAGYLRAAGHTVTGSDGPLYPPMSDMLQRWGLKPIEGFRPENLEPRPDLVVIGNAVGKTNPEAIAVIERAIPFISMAQAIRQFGIEGRESLVITGTHGKTTTTAMTAFLLNCAGKDPGAIFGGVLKNTGESFFRGHHRYFVVEGDEYETAFFDKGPKFFHYAPHHLLVGNLEFDHLDNFKSLDALEDAFSRLAALVPVDGSITVGLESPAALRAVKNSGSRARVLTFGLDPAADIHAKNIAWHPDGTHFDAVIGGVDVPGLESQMLGAHNLRNALGALALAHACGVDAATLRRCLALFQGVKRRQEFCGFVVGAMPARIYDDFGHHPTAVKETLEAFRQHGHRNLWAILEPKSYTSSTNRFQDDFARAIAGRCERAFALGVWWNSKLAQADRFSPEKLAADLNAQGTRAESCVDPDALESALRSALREEPDPANPPTLVFFSSGTHGGVRERMLTT